MSAARTTTMRLRSVRFKDGRAPVSAGAVGQYAKDVIQAEQAVRWSRD